MQVEELFEAEAVDAIRDALHIGIACYGEILRLQNQFELEAIGGREIPQELRPIDPVAHSEQVSDFAEALRSVARLSDALNQADRSARLKAAP